LEKYTEESKKFSHSFGQNYGKTFQGVWDASFWDFLGSQSSPLFVIAGQARNDKQWQSSY